MAVNGHKVVAWIPYGRRNTVELLLRYLLRDRFRGIVDEIWFCFNMDAEQKADRIWAESMASKYDIRIIERPSIDSQFEGIPFEWLKPAKPKQLNTGRFFWYMQEPETIYVRFDDDIVWIHEEAIRRLAQYKLARQDRFVVFPIIFNNAISSYILQQNGKIPMDWGQVGSYTHVPTMVSAVDPVGWADPLFADKLHNLVLQKIKNNSIDDMMIDNETVLGINQQFSVSCFAIEGKSYAKYNGIIPVQEEEHWATQYEPSLTKIPNAVWPQALVSHYTFFRQRDYIEQHTNILQWYAEIAPGYGEEL